MKFKATIEQIKQIAANAVNASDPGGPQSMGWLHHTDKVFQPTDITMRDNMLSLDYVQGRMVKLHMRCVNTEEQIWEVSGSVPRPDYQSWYRTYPTFASLLQSVEGVTIIEETA